jgi:hypothetical protein
MLTVLLIVLIVLAFGGGFYHAPFRGPGISIGAILFIVLLFYLLGGFR